MKIAQITSEDPQFPDFIQFQKDHPYSHFFQSDIYYNFLDGLANQEPILLIYEDDQGRITGSLLARYHFENSRFGKFLSSRILVIGNPLIGTSCENTESVIYELLQCLVVIAKQKANFIEIRNFSDQQHFNPLYKKCRFVYREHLNLITSTFDPKTTWDNISKNRKRQIISSFKNGATVIEEPTLDEFQQFYKILKNLYSVKIKKPLPDWSFFKKYYNTIKQKQHGIIHLIRYQDKIVGGIICPISNQKAIHEWFICGLDWQYKANRIYPSVLATWSAIEFASKNDIKEFDFMGMGRPADTYGVRDFKVRFGGKLVNFGRFERINNYSIHLITLIGYKLFILMNSILARLRFSK